jgi:ABC-type amino acid transport system permease subunit
MDRLIQYMSHIYVNVSRIYPAHVTFLFYYFGSIIGNCFTSIWQIVKKYTSYTADRYFQLKH